MEITLLIKFIMGLVVLLGFLIFLLILPSKTKKKVTKLKPISNVKTPQKRVESTDLESLRAIIKDKKSDKKLLQETLELIIKHHGTIHPKLGVRPHPDFEIYKNILLTICRHPNTNKNLVVYFDKELTRLNQTYKSNINDAVTSGLNSRGL